MAKKNNIQKSLDVFQGIDKGKIPPNKVDKESDERKKKRTDRGLKYKPDYKKCDD